MNISKYIDTPFWLMIGVILSQIGAGYLMERYTDLGIGGPIIIIGVVMIGSLCTIKVLAFFDLPARWREARLRRARERAAEKKRQLAVAEAADRLEHAGTENEERDVAGLPSPTGESDCDD